MKTKVFLILLVFLLGSGLSSCAVRMKSNPGHSHKEKTIPPGQVKKMTGSKSAKKYAPGHNK